MFYQKFIVKTFSSLPPNYKCCFSTCMMTRWDLSRVTSHSRVLFYSSVDHMSITKKERVSYDQKRTPFRRQFCPGRSRRMGRGSRSKFPSRISSWQWVADLPNHCRPPHDVSIGIWETKQCHIALLTASEIRDIITGRRLLCPQNNVSRWLPLESRLKRRAKLPPFRRGQQISTATQSRP